MIKIKNIIISFILTLALVSLFSSNAFADSKKQKELKIISELKESIENLGETPEKRIKGKHNLRKDYIAVLEEQLEKLKKKYKIEEKKQVMMDDLINQIKELDPDASLANEGSEDSLDKDKDIIALKKQLEQLKKEKEAAKVAAKKEADKKAKEDKEKKKREEAILRVKKEIYFLGGTPILEYEVDSDDEYVAALKEQIEKLKKEKAAEEKRIAESLPDWFIIPPGGSDTLFYIRGTAISDNLQYSLDFATNAALRELGKRLQTKLSSKVKEIFHQKGVGEDQSSKIEFESITNTVVQEVNISDFKVMETKIVNLDSGSYRAFVLLEYPVVKAYQAFVDEIEENPGLKGRLTEIKNTEAYKDLKSAIEVYSGS
tara:strand:+ start:842 stop:1960 length:1119 start_codon:yes stop_codon:yes gene_type:complete